MKKEKLSLTIFAIAVLGFFSAHAQKHGDKPSNIMDVGSVTLNIGVGVGNGYTGTYSNDYSGVYGTGFGGKVAIERGFWKLGPGVLTLGIEGGGSFSNGSGYNYDNGYKSSIVIFAGRSAYHYGWNVPGLDTYAGLSAGVGFRSYNYINNTNKDTKHKVDPVIGGFAGASYFFTPKFGVNAEVGNDITYIQGGVIFKLN
jgi:hypothetical protein